jgi:HEAT repeat protein
MMTMRRMLFALVFLFAEGLTAFPQSPGLSTTLENLRSSDEQTRLVAARSLPYVWQTAPDLPALVDQLILLLSSTDQHVRLSVLATLEQIGLLHPDKAPSFAKSKQALLGATQDPLLDVRQYAIAVLGMTRGAPDEDLKNVALRAFTDPSHKVRRIALGMVSFKKLNDPEIVTAVLALASSNPGDLSQAIDALGDIAPTDPRAIQLFVNALRGDSVAVKQSSLIALSKAGKAATAALPVLRQLVADTGQSELLRTLAKDTIKKVEGATP